MTGKLLLGGAIATGLYFALRKKETPAVTVTNPEPAQPVETTPGTFSNATPTNVVLNTNLNTRMRLTSFEQSANDSNIGCCGNPKYLY